MEISQSNDSFSPFDLLLVRATIKKLAKVVKFRVGLFTLNFKEWNIQYFILDLYVHISTLRGSEGDQDNFFFFLM